MTITIVLNNTYISILPELANYRLSNNRLTKHPSINILSGFHNLLETFRIISLHVSRISPNIPESSKQWHTSHNWGLLTVPKLVPGSVVAWLWWVEGSKPPFFGCCDITYQIFVRTCKYTCNTTELLSQFMLICASSGSVLINQIL